MVVSKPDYYQQQTPCTPLYSVLYIQAVRMTLTSTRSVRSSSVSRERHPTYTAAVKGKGPPFSIILARFLGLGSWKLKNKEFSVRNTAQNRPTRYQNSKIRNSKKSDRSTSTGGKTQSSLREKGPKWETRTTGSIWYTPQRLEEVFLTAAVASRFFPKTSNRISPKKVAGRFTFYVTGVWSLWSCSLLRISTLSTYILIVHCFRTDSIWWVVRCIPAESQILRGGEQEQILLLIVNICKHVPDRFLCLT